ncbi:Glutathione S-transferase [Sulfidibacter corallicola]|uniref:Glutathione S-transferase n=1 Tax=Sulfidibacter corallicola TaxID=2818388 RepID=A0A8A4TQ42_SULCO|nr:glutathione S-transferase [Sulfidibacter corallicola]QTD51680.1 glutathione S-transferase [Sulfidibacter corallicola]
MYTLFDLELSGNCYSVRLFLAFLDLPYQRRTVDLMAGEHRLPEFLELNPKGEIPVLRDGDQVIYDSQAILIYLAEKEEAEDWYPRDPLTRAHIHEWLSTSANEIAHGPATARLVKHFGFPLDYDRARTQADKILPLIEAHLAERDWLVGNRPTIADVAIYPYVALSGDGEISLEPFGHIRAWLKRFGNLRNFIPMPGLARV